jgi:release factor glutamine methyltransferase
MTPRELLREGIALLKGKVDTPMLDARLLLCEALHSDMAGVMSGEPAALPAALPAARPVSEAAATEYRRVLERRLAGECVAYILGRKEFWGLEFSVSPAVLVPRPDTETLVEAALAAIDKLGAGCRVLDLCTGSGAVAIALKHERPGLEVSASDISPAALDVARLNAKRLHVDIRFIESDLFARIDGFFDIISANPPYIPAALIDSLAPELRWEPRLALDGGAEGLDCVRRLILGARAHLVPGGLLFIEADPGQMAAISGVLGHNGYGEARTYRDLAGRERIISVFSQPAGAAPQGYD